MYVCVYVCVCVAASQQLRNKHYQDAYHEANSLNNKDTYRPFGIMGLKVSTKWRKYGKTCVNRHVLMFSYKKTTSKHVCLCFLHLVLTFTPHYIIMVLLA